MQAGHVVRVVAYASRALSAAEWNYNTNRRELLAVLYGFKQFRKFFRGHCFALRGDHYMRKTPGGTGQATRWLDYIEIMILI